MTNFWSQVLLVWAEVNHKFPQNKAQVLEEIIWFNSSIKINGTMIHWPNWICNGIIFIEDLLLPNGSFKDIIMLNTEPVNWLSFEQLKSAIPKVWKAMLLETHLGNPEPKLIKKLGARKGVTISKQVYDLLIANGFLLNKYLHRWYRIGMHQEEINLPTLRQLFNDLHCYVKNVKLKNFQYRLLLAKIITNIELVEWNIIETNVCNLCKKAPETLKHLFVESEFTKIMLTLLVKFAQMMSKEIKVNFTTVICNTICEQRSHILNYVCLIAKQFMYKMRCQKSTFTRSMLVNAIQEVYNIGGMLKSWAQFKSGSQVVTLMQPKITRRSNVLKDGVPSITKCWRNLHKYIAFI